MTTVRQRRALLLVSALFLSLIQTAPAIAPVANAAGTPDIQLAVGMPGETLHGATTPVTLTATNGTSTHGYNLGFRVVLPAGVSLASSSFPAEVLDDVPASGQTTLFFSNISDLPAGGSNEISLSLAHNTSAWTVGETFPVAADAYVNSDERVVPKIGTDGVVSDASGSDSASNSTLIVPFQLTKSEPSPESELVRGLHDQQTIYTISVEAAPFSGSTSVAIEDWIPAGLEFLGCGGGDNSTIGEEYPGSGPIAVPAVAGCVPPTLVETVDSGLPAGASAGVYTHVVWDAATLGASVSAGGTYELKYAAAIPMQMNTMDWGALPAPDPTLGTQARNIDNNATGASTAETTTELAFTNHAFATATYQANGGSYTDGGTHTVTSEDVALHKTVDTDISYVGAVSEWTLEVRTSEYAAASDSVTVTDIIPDGLCPGLSSSCALDGASPAFSSATEANDGTWNVRWDLGTLGQNSTRTLVYNTTQLVFYQENQAPDVNAPVLAHDTWSNSASLTATVDGQAVEDVSSRDQETTGTTISKEVAVPQVPMSCGDGSGLTWDADSAGLYGPGDRVCWRIRLDTPHIWGGSQTLVDFLPPGFAYESWDFGASNTPAIEPLVDFDTTPANLAAGRLTWTFDAAGPDLKPPDTTFEAVIASIAGAPSTASAGDLLGNLLKYTGANSDGEIYFDRDDAEAEWGEPEISIDKVEDAGITTVAAGDTTDFTITVTNDGNRPALDVEVWDVLPAGLGCATVSAISDGGACGAGETIRWTIPSIAPGASFGVTYDVTIPATVGPGESYTNETGVRQFETAVNTGSSDRYVFIPEDNIDPGQNPGNTDPALDDWTLATPDITVSKSGITSIIEPGNNRNGQATIGEIVTFRIETVIPAGTTVYSLSNGDTPHLRDDIDPRYTYQGDAQACGQFTSAAATCTPVDDPPDWDVVWESANNRLLVEAETATFVVPAGGPDFHLVTTFSAEVADQAGTDRGDRIRNRGRFRWRNSVSSNNLNIYSGWKDIRVVEPNLVIEKINDDADNIVAAGQVLTYTVTVTNVTGSRVAPAHDVDITDTLPLGIDCLDLSAISDSGTCIDASPKDILSWPTVPTLNSGEQLVRTFSATMPSPIIADTTFTNDAEVIASSIVGSPAGSRVGDTPTAPLDSGYFDRNDDEVTAPRSTIAKSVTPTEQTVGELVTYTVEVTLPGNVQQFDTTVIDHLPTGISTPLTGYTLSSSCEMGGVSCVFPYDVTVSELQANGGDIGWYLGHQIDVPGQPRIVTIVYEATVDRVAGNIEGTVLTNTANLYGNRTPDPGGPPTSVPDSPNYDISGIEDSATVTVREPDVTIVKEVFDGTSWVDARRALPNEQLQYRLRIANSRPWPAYDVLVSDTIVTHSGDAMVPVTIPGGAGYSVTDADPSDGSLAWRIDGPLTSASDIVIPYTLQVWDADEGDEDDANPEIVNTASVDEYWAVPTNDPTRHRRYVGNTDLVEIELDLASVGDYVWFDVNGDGVQDATEPPLAGVGVRVTYLGPDDAPGGGDDEVHNRTTDANGLYLVEDLPGGSYVVTVVSGVPAGLTPTFDLDGASAPPPDGEWLGVLAEDAAKRDVDFGYTGTGSIGDLVWFNRNGNGTQDAQEPGLPGVSGTVTFAGWNGVLGDADDVVYPVTTDANGIYTVDLLPAGLYRVSFNAATVPAGLTQNYDPDGTLDSTHDLNLSAGQDFDAADFGYAGPSTIGDRVWLDENRDGLQDASEPGIENVTVQLVWPGPDGISGTPDDVTFTDTTDADGTYGFVGLNEGEYAVIIDTSTLPVGLDNTYAEDSVLNDRTTVNLPSAPTAHVTADFGYAGTGSIGDLVWWDLNADGVQDVGEPGIPNVDLTIVWEGSDGTLGTADDVTYPATTDADGRYLVTFLPAGEFRVSVTDPVTSAADNTFDFDGGNDNTADVTLAPSESNLGLDFGYAGTGSIGDFVWYDINADGVQDTGEPGLGGVTVTATFYGLDGAIGGGDDVVLTTATAPDGSYGFVNTPAGNHEISVEPGTLPAGMTPTFDRDGTPDGNTLVALAFGEDVTDADFGYVGSGSIGDTVWWDVDRDGVRSAGEPGWSGVGVTITWFGVDGTAGTADDATINVATSATGVYLVGGLPAGEYRVEVDRSSLPADLAPTFDPDGGADDQSELTLAGGESNLDQDFGYAGSSSLGDFVWLDANADGVQDPFEPGVAGVPVSVVWLGPDGVPGGGDDVTFETTTDASGLYEALGLVAGTYDVLIDEASLPAGVVAGSDVDGGDPATSNVALGIGEIRDDVDFGLVGTSSLNGTVWHDKNADGAIDPGEEGLGGATVDVVWHGPDGDITTPVTTGPDGSWSLNGIPSGDYTATLDNTTVPAGYVNTTPQAVDVVVPAGGSATVDHGVVGGVTVGFFVWIDTNGNGVKDGAEVGIPGVRVEFIHSGVSTFTVTDAEGRYLFRDQFPGQFTVRLDPATIPAGLVQTYSRDGVLNLETTGSVAELSAVLDVNFGFQETSLPTTGVDVGGFGFLAVVLMFVGSIGLVVGRRKDEQGD